MVVYKKLNFWEDYTPLQDHLAHHHPPTNDDQLSTFVVLQTDSMRASFAKIAFLISHLSSTV